MSTSPKTIGDPPLPCCDEYRNCAFQMSSPFVLMAAVPSAPKWTKTRSPSRTGVGVAREFLGLMGSPPLNLNTSAFTSSLPLSTSNATARRDALSYEVSQTRPPATTGEDQPVPG